MKHFKVTFAPDAKQVSVLAGTVLIEAAGRAGVILSAVCGGKGTCEKCKVTLLPDKVSVLACQYRVTKDLTVEIPPTSRILEQKILSSGPELKITPDIYKKYLKHAPAGSIFGLSVDVGTTTIVAKLLDIFSGQCKAVAADLNPQIRYGDDVISRISYAESDENLSELQKSVVDCLNDLIQKLAVQSAIKPSQIYESCIVGNTTMNHILLKLPVVQLGLAPYSAFSLAAYDLCPDNLSLNINSVGNIHITPNISGFLGSDTLAAALASDISSIDDNTVLVDIGTNGEIVLSAQGKLYAASCAAGPALEGARISCGSRAQTGAIEAVIMNQNDIDVETINDEAAVSICGSGLIDAVAVMLDLGIIDSSGRFVESAKLPVKVSSRLVQRNNQPAFKITDEIILTQRDIREVQLAKAAILTGIKILQKKVGIEDSGISQVLLAGAFGNYISKKSAVRIGLLPKVELHKIRFIGNAASLGAEMMLLSENARSQAEKLAKKIEYVEIANEKDFADIYADAMIF